MAKALIRHEMLPVVHCASPQTVWNQHTYVEATIEASSTDTCVAAFVNLAGWLCIICDHTTYS